MATIFNYFFLGQFLINSDANHDWFKYLCQQGTCHLVIIFIFFKSRYFNFYRSLAMQIVSSVFGSQVHP